MFKLNQIREKIISTQVWKSIFRDKISDNSKSRISAIAGNALLHLHPIKIKKFRLDVGYTWCMGGITFFLFLLLIGSGALLMFFYRPVVEYAYIDMWALKNQLSFGILREIHRWSAHGMIITVMLHMLRVFMTGSYKPPREFNWVLGVLLLLLTIVLFITGNVLPWDQKAFWSSSISLKVVSFKFPGTDLANAKSALLRFYVLHCIVLPLALMILAGVHFWRVKRDSGISPRL